MLSEEAKEYIRQNQELLEEDKFQEFFDSIDSNRDGIAEFFLLDCKINFLDYMEYIPSFLFAGSENLKDINIPSSIKKIGFCAFNNCSNLESVSIPKSVIKMGDDVFAGCNSLRKIRLPKIFKSRKYLGIDENKTKIIWY